jgi:hypothetical protein
VNVWTSASSLMVVGAMHESPRALQSGLCRICKEAAPGHPIRVLLTELQPEDWHLCRSCWRHLERGFQRITPEDAFEPYLNGRGFRFTEPQIRSYITAGLQPDEEWQRLVGGKLRAIGADLDAATAATNRRDWPAVLEAVRMLQGRAVITRTALERLLGPCTVAADLPPLVRAVQAVGLLIREGEIESLPPDELRVRMHAVLQTLDYELAAFLEAPD